MLVSFNIFYIYKCIIKYKAGYQQEARLKLAEKGKKLKSCTNQIKLKLGLKINIATKTFKQRLKLEYQCTSVY